MQTPNVDYSATRLHDSFGHYVLAQLQADSALASEAEEFAAAQEALSARQQEYRQAVGRTVGQLAARDLARIAVVETLRTFHFTVKLQAKGDLNSPLYYSYFPDGIERITAGTMDECIVQAQAILRQLESETIPEIQAHATPITTALDRARSALQALDDAREAKTAASKVLFQEKVRWVDIYLQVYARLRLHHHRSPRRAEGYFRRSRVRRKDEADAGGEEAVQVSTGEAGSAVTTSVPDARDEKAAA
jgi:hypothetical protein